MSAIDQYTGFFEEHRDAIDAHSAGILNSRREAALDSLKRNPLPRMGSENHERIDLEAMLSPDYGININRVPMAANPAASFRCGVPALTKAMIFQVNDIVCKPSDASGMLPQGIFAGSLAQFCEQFPEIAGRHYARLADIENPLVALNTLLVQDGIAIYIPKDARVENPIQLVNILASSAPLMAVRRVLIILGENAEVRLLACDHTQTPDIELMNLQTVEIFAGKNSRLDWCEMEESSDFTRRISSLWLAQEEGSRVTVNGMALSNGMTRNDYRTVFRGSDAYLKLTGMGIVDRYRVLDNYSLIDHASPRCTTEELFKYVVDNAATGAFAGLVLVRPGAVKTEAYQSNRNIVGTDTCRMFSKPQLEIYNDDVKCSHGSATGQLDEMQVFYMRTRGIPEEKAKLLLKQAFMADIIDSVGIPRLKERLTMLTERRFNGDDTSCASCQAPCAIP